MKILIVGHGFVGMMVSLVPVLTIVVSIPILGVFPSRTQLAGVLIGMICALVCMARFPLEHLT